MKNAKKRPRAIVFAGYGLNCEDETKFAFASAGARADIVHINDLIAGQVNLKDYNILAIPGGFSFGDDTGSGRGYANRMRNHLSHELEAFIKRDTLTIGICNGFQVLTNAGLLPGAIIQNDIPRYLDRWVDLKATGKGPWLSGIDHLSLPIAHGEGKFYAPAPVLKKLEKQKRVAFVYTKGEMTKNYHLPYNPNGSLHDIAAMTSEDGRIFGIMPHPERAMFFTQLPHWTTLREQYRNEGAPIPKEGPGIEIFKNAVRYFTE